VTWSGTWGAEFEDLYFASFAPPWFKGDGALGECAGLSKRPEDEGFAVSFAVSSRRFSTTPAPLGPWPARYLRVAGATVNQYLLGISLRPGGRIHLDAVWGCPPRLKPVVNRPFSDSANLDAMASSCGAQRGPNHRCLLSWWLRLWRAAELDLRAQRCGAFFGYSLLQGNLGWPRRCWCSECRTQCGLRWRCNGLPAGPLLHHSRLPGGDWVRKTVVVPSRKAVFN